MEYHIALSNLGCWAVSEKSEPSFAIRYLRKANTRDGVLERVTQHLAPSNLGHQGAGKILEDIWTFDIESQTWNKVQLAVDELPQARGWFNVEQQSVKATWHPCIPSSTITSIEAAERWETIS